MTYTPPVFINNYYGYEPRTGTNSVGVESIPRNYVTTSRSFNSTSQFIASTTVPVFSVAIKPQINMLNLQYIDFYGATSAITGGGNTAASFRWSIQQANIFGTGALGGSVANGMALYPNNTPTTSITHTAMSMSSISTKKETATFTNPFNLYAGLIYYVDCFCTVTASPTSITTTFSGTTLGTTDESFYRDKITLTGATINTSSPHLTIATGDAGKIYSGMRIVQTLPSNGSNILTPGANIVNPVPASSTTAFDLNVNPTVASGTGAATIVAYDLTRSIAAGARTFSTATDNNKPNIVDFIPYIRIRGSG